MGARRKIVIKKYLRLIGAGALTFAVALTAGVALAEPGQFAGRFTFQSDDLEPGPEVNIISGFATVRQQDDGTYDVVLLSTDLFQTAAGDTVRQYAFETCIGQLKGTAMEISCEIRQTTDADFTANNFRLQYIPDSIGLWRGTTPMDADTTVEFFSFGD